MIRIDQLSKRFGRLQVLKSLQLEIEGGGIFAVLGPNGSGKTTLIKSILGMVVPDEGDITIDGRSVLKRWKYRNNISYLPQIARFPNNLTVTELLRMIRDLRSKESRHPELIELFELEPFLNKKLGNLSGGTKQKVNLVLAFMFESDLILLDEPTAGLDPISLIHLRDLFQQERSKGRTIIVTTHIMSFAEEISDEIVFVLDGKIHFKGTVGRIQDETGQSTLETAIAALLRASHP
jgi:Cu-processing system ATP-binding protein